MSSYLIATVHVTNDKMEDDSKTVGLAYTLLLPANNNRAGFLIQNNTANDLWWGYDTGVAVGKAGYFCLTGGKHDRYRPPANGIFKGNIFAVFDVAAGNVVAKQWTA